MRASRSLFSTLAYLTMFIFGLQVCGQQFILLDIAEEYQMNKTAMGALSSVGFITGLCSAVLLAGLSIKKIRGCSQEGLQRQSRWEGFWYWLFPILSG